MKAATYDRFGGPENITISTMPVPEIREGEVMVRIRAAGVNPVDNAILHGYLKDHIPCVFPVIPGWDMAGTVEACGYSARRFANGDEVFAYARRPTVQYGTFAEYIVIPESYLAKKPGNLSWEETAGIPLAGLTAYQSVYDAGALRNGQTILILGASGGVGSMAIQLAKAKGATVIAVASEKNFGYMKQLGADITVDYNEPDLAGAIRANQPKGVDLIFDCISGDTLQKSLAVLKPSGRLVSILNRGTDLDKKITFRYVFVEPNATHLAHLCLLAEQGKLKVRVSKTYPLKQTAAALNQIATHHTTGKIVIAPLT